MFFSVTTKNINWESLTKNLVTIKRWDGVKDETFEYYGSPLKKQYIGRYFSHVTKSRIFRNINLRKKSRWRLSRHFPEKPFQTPKIIFKSPKLIGQKSLSYAHLLKDKRLKFTFLRQPTFQVLVCGSSPPKKT